MANFDEQVAELLAACEPTINLYKSFGWSAMLVRDYKVKAFDMIIEANKKD